MDGQRRNPRDGAARLRRWPCTPLPRPTQPSRYGKERSSHFTGAATATPVPCRNAPLPTRRRLLPRLRPPRRRHAGDPAARLAGRPARLARRRPAARRGRRDRPRPARVRGVGQARGRPRRAVRGGGPGAQRDRADRRARPAPPVVCGYDVGSRVAQAIAAERELRALVLAPPLPGAGERVLGADGHREFWYQHFHRLELPAQIIDGNREAVRAYLQHFWSHWSGPGLRARGRRARPAGRRLRRVRERSWPRSTGTAAARG